MRPWASRLIQDTTLSSTSLSEPGTMGGWRPLLLRGCVSAMRQEPATAPLPNVVWGKPSVTGLSRLREVHGRKRISLSLRREVLVVTKWKGIVHWPNARSPDKVDRSQHSGRSLQRRVVLSCPNTSQPDQHSERILPCQCKHRLQSTSHGHNWVTAFRAMIGRIQGARWEPLTRRFRERVIQYSPARHQ